MSNHKRRRTRTLTSQLFNTDTTDLVREARELSDQIHDLGMTACLYAFSHLSFGGDEFAEVCAEHYHLLREYALGHVEARGILAAID